MDRTVTRVAIRLQDKDVDAVVAIRTYLDLLAGGDCGYSLTQLMRFALYFTSEALQQSPAHTHEETQS